MKLAALILIALAGNAYAATAFWTGRSQQGQSVTGMYVMNCEYNYAGRTFWQAFSGYCPNTVEIQ